MPSQALTREPTALTGLQTGKTYQGEVKARGTVFFLPSTTVPSGSSAEASSVKPDDSDRRFQIEKTAQEIYVWAGGGPNPLGSVEYHEV